MTGGRNSTGKGRSTNAPLLTCGHYNRRQHGQQGSNLCAAQAGSLSNSLLHFFLSTTEHVAEQLSGTSEGLGTRGLIGRLAL